MCHTLQEDLLRRETAKDHRCSFVLERCGKPGPSDWAHAMAYYPGGLPLPEDWVYICRMLSDTTLCQHYGVDAVARLRTRILRNRRKEGMEWAKLRYQWKMTGHLLEKWNSGTVREKRAVLHEGRRLLGGWKQTPPKQWIRTFLERFDSRQIPTPVVGGGCCEKETSSDNAERGSDTEQDESEDIGSKQIFIIQGVLDDGSDVDSDHSEAEDPMDVDDGCDDRTNVNAVTSCDAGNATVPGVAIGPGGDADIDSDDSGAKDPDIVMHSDGDDVVTMVTIHEKPADVSRQSAPADGRLLEEVAAPPSEEAAVTNGAGLATDPPSEIATEDR